MSKTVIFKGWAENFGMRSRTRFQTLKESGEPSVETASSEVPFMPLTGIEVKLFKIHETHEKKNQKQPSSQQTIVVAPTLAKSRMDEKTMKGGASFGSIQVSMIAGQENIEQLLMNKLHLYLLFHIQHLGFK